MNLLEVLEKQYFLEQTRVADAKTRSHYRRSVKYLGQMLERPPLLSDLTDAHVAGLLNWLQISRGVSPETANHSRKCLVALWRWCRDKDLVRGGPTVAKLKVPRRRPRAMSEDELRRLVEASQQMPGTIGGYPAPTWWLTLLAIEIDTGMRAGELLSLRWEWIDWERGRIDVPAESRKGKSEDASYWLPPTTRQWLAALRQPSGLILGFANHASRYYQLWDDLLEAAGLPKGRRNKTHMLRRTFATLVAQHGGDPTAALGHSDPSVAKRHYLDADMLDERHAERIPEGIRPLRIAGLG